MSAALKYRGDVLAVTFSCVPVDERRFRGAIPLRPTGRPEVELGELCFLCCMLKLLGPAGVGVFLPERRGSMVEVGRIFEGVPPLLLAGVEGEAPPTRELRAPERGVTLLLKVEAVGDRTSSFRPAGATCGSGRVPRRGGLDAGDCGFEPANLGVSGPLMVRKVELKVGVNGLAFALLFCLSCAVGAMAIGLRRSDGFEG